jgi:hypothetical protein
VLLRDQVVDNEEPLAFDLGTLELLKGSLGVLNVLERNEALIEIVALLVSINLGRLDLAELGEKGAETLISSSRLEVLNKEGL